MTPEAGARPQVVSSCVEPLWFLGTLMRIKLDGAQTAGRFALADGVLPRGASPPLHSHPQDETFYVLEGELTAWVVDRELGEADRGDRPAPRRRGSSRCSERSASRPSGPGCRRRPMVPASALSEWRLLSGSWGWSATDRLRPLPDRGMPRTAGWGTRLDPLRCRARQRSEASPARIHMS
jgi:Cupin domain